MAGAGDISGDLARTLVEQLPYGLVVLAPVRDDAGLVVDVRFEYLNAQASRLLGYLPSRLDGAELSRLNSPRAGPVVTALCDRALRTTDVLLEVVPTRMGHIRLAARAVGDVVLLVARDLQGDAASVAVHQLRESLESTSDHIAVLVPLRDEFGDISDFTCSYVNDRALRSMEMMSGRLDVPLREAMPGYPEWLIDGYRQVMQTGVPFVTEHQQESRRGLTALHIVATRYQDGLIVATRDVSAQANAQQELARSEERFRSTVEAMREAIAVLRSIRGADGSIIDFEIEFVNAAAEQLTRQTLDQLITGRVLEVLPFVRDHGVFDRLVEVVASGESITLEMPGPIGDEVGAVEASFVRLGDGLIAVGRDITERARQQKRIEESERRFHQLAENAGDAVFYGTTDGLLWVSPSVEQLLGWKPEELIGASPLVVIHRDDQPSVVRSRPKYKAGETSRQRFRLIRRDGTPLWVESLVRSIPAIDGVDDGLIVSTVWSVQAEVEAQEALARAEADRRATEARLNQAARLESLGVMAGGIAHDFNNLLVGVMGNAELALMELPLDAPVRQRIERITLAAQRAADLTRQLLDYTGSRTGTLDIVDLGALVEETRDLVAERLARGVVLTCTTDARVPFVRGDRAQLQQVVLNLVINAADALGDEPGHVTVHVRAVDLDTPPPSIVSLASALTPGRYVEMTVTDDGPGMSTETLQRVFEPFYTTKPTGRGLGLAVVHGVLRAHSGAVIPTSTEHVGTTMTVLLPASDDAAQPAAAATDVAPAPIDPPLVLVIDDDDGVREVSVMVLERAGMRVHAERDGRAAIDEFARRPDDFAVVLLDLTMPQMSGDEVLAELRQIRDSVPVVVISGYSDADVHDRLVDLSIDGFVEKPFRPPALVDAIRRALVVQERGI